MQNHIAWSSAVAVFGLLAAANAQVPAPPAAGTAVDGTYRLVSSANVNATYTSRKGQTAPCPPRRAGPLHIENGRVRYTTATGIRVRGTVGPQGELAMRASAPSSWANQPIDLTVSGTVDGSGAARVRQLSHSCSYDFVWQKASR
jgi:hypothetical protein